TVCAVVERMQDADGLAVQCPFPAHDINLRTVRLGVFELALPSFLEPRTQRLQVRVQGGAIARRQGQRDSKCSDKTGENTRCVHKRASKGLFVLRRIVSDHAMAVLEKIYLQSSTGTKFGY